MKRSQVIMLFAGGTALAGVYAHHENQNCRPDASGNTPSYCSHGSSGHYYGFGGGTGSSSSSSVARGGFGAMGAAHGGGRS